MIEILKKYEDNGYEVTEYTRDGKTISSTVKELMSSDVALPTIPQPSIGEEILFETKYQTMLLEMGGM